VLGYGSSVQTLWHECSVFFPNSLSNLDRLSQFFALISGLGAAAATVLRSDRIAAHDESGKTEFLPLNSALGVWALSMIVVASLSANYTVWSDSRSSARAFALEREEGVRNLDSGIGGRIHDLQYYHLPRTHKREEFWNQVRGAAIGFPSGYGGGLLIDLQKLERFQGFGSAPQGSAIDRAITGAVKLSDLAAVRAASGGDGDVSDSDRELVNGILRTYFDDPRWKKGWNRLRG
jgi:hypothetical protein